MDSVAITQVGVWVRENGWLEREARTQVRTEEAGPKNRREKEQNSNPFGVTFVGTVMNRQPRNPHLSCH
jgi:hypothetical protein